MLQGRRKHFRIGQAIKIFCLLCSQISLHHHHLQGFFMACRHFMVCEVHSGILPRLPLLLSILLDLVQTHSKIQCYLGCGSGNATRATGKSRTPSKSASLLLRHLRTNNQSNLCGIKYPPKCCLRRKLTCLVSVFVYIFFFRL